KLFMDVALYNTRIMGAGHVESVTDLACRPAIAHRGVAHITMPVDIQNFEVNRKEQSTRNVSHHTSDVCSMGAVVPPTSDLNRAAEILNKGKRVAMLVGRGALRASDLLEPLAEVLGAPIVKAL